MTLVQSWVDSLTLLKPKNLQLFIMVTIKSIKETYVLMFYYWSWLMVVLVLCYSLPLFFPKLFFSKLELAVGDIGVSGYIPLISRWGYQVLIFATCLATRPSMMQKNCAYFRSQMISFLYIALFLCAIPLSIWPSALSPWSIFLILFFLDSAKGPKNFLLSMWYALKMIIFNYPLMVCVGICFYMPVVLLNSIFFIPLMVHNIVAVLLLPVGICTYANIYIKKVHDQFDLYFKQS